jgi:hypothetical protein
LVLRGRGPSHSDRHGKRLFDHILHIFAAAGAQDGWIPFVGGRAKKKVAGTLQNCEKLQPITPTLENSAPSRSSLFTASSASNRPPPQPTPQRRNRLHHHTAKPTAATPPAFAFFAIAIAALASVSVATAALATAASPPPSNPGAYQDHQSRYAFGGLSSKLSPPYLSPHESSTVRISPVPNQRRASSLSVRKTAGWGER